MENFNNPFFDRLVGIPSDQKELEQQWSEHITDIVYCAGEKIEGIELEKTEKDIELIHFTEASVDAVLAKYGRTKVVSIPLENIHVLKENGTEIFTEGLLRQAGCSVSKKSMLVDRSSSDVDFSLRLFHEFIDLKSFSSAQVMPGSGDEAGSTKMYRSGISVVSRDGKKTYLGDFEEAVIGHLVSSYYEDTIKKDDRFKDEVKNIDTERFKVDTSRQDEIKKLDSVIDEIFQCNRDLFADKKQILDMFIDAEVNGNLMKVGRVIEKTFGKGSLKKIDVRNLQ